jgi:hypothetical protein
MMFGLPQLSIDPVLFLPLWRGTLRDYSPAAQSVTPSPGHWGTTGQRDGYYCTPAGARLQVAHSTSLSSPDITLFWSGRHFKQVPNARIFSKRDGGGLEYELFTSTTTLALNDGSNIRSRAVDLTSKRSVAVAIESGQAAQVYLDGALDGPMNGTSTIVGTTAALNVTGYWVANFPWENKLELALVYPGPLSAAEVGRLHDYSQAAGTPRLQWPGAGLDLPGRPPLQSGDPTYVDNVQSARVSLANETSGQLSNSGWRIASGTWLVAEDVTGRYYSCVGSGTLERTLVGAASMTTKTFDYTGTASLTKGTALLELDATTGAKITAVELTAA